MNFGGQHIELELIRKNLSTLEQTSYKEQYHGLSKKVNLPMINN